MIRKLRLPKSESCIIIKYYKNTASIAKNDLPSTIMMYITNSGIYNSMLWSMMNMKCIEHRDNDNPSRISESDYNFTRFSNNFRYNGYDYYNLYPEMYKNYKFIRGICLEQLKEEVTND